MNLRPYQPADQQAVIQLWQKCNLTRDYNDPVKDIQRKLDVNREWLIVGELDGKIVAAAMFGYEGHRGSVNYLAIDPNCQGRGYGAQVMQYIEQKLLELKCPQINLQIRSENTAVMDFYLKNGYKTSTAITMCKRLISDL